MDTPTDEEFTFQWMLGPDGRTPKRVRKDDIPAWVEWWNTPGSDVVAQSVVAPEGGGPGLLVSTVFLAVDHGWGLSDTPLLFETMIFAEGGPLLEEYCERYSTYDEARFGHQRALIVAEAMLAARGL